jgi:hypothetical protein
MQDIVVGCITGYTWDKIKVWVNSLDQSGFKGQKIMLCYNIGYDVAEELTKRDYTIIAFKRNDEEKRFEYKENFNIMLERFIHLWYFLNRIQDKQNYRYVIATDVRDVIFQKNPSEWLEKNLGDKTINVASESIRYKDEPWGKNNLTLSFGPLIYEANQNNLVYNAGTVSGKLDTMLDLFLNLYMSCGGAPQNVPGGGGPDQAALNVLLNTVTYKNTTRFTKSEEGWAAQLGTTADPSKLDSFKPFLDEPSPIMKDGLVCTSKGEPFYLVHQYDRVPEWKEIIEKKYA